MLIGFFWLLLTRRWSSWFRKRPSCNSFIGCYISVPWMLRLCSMDVTSLSHGCYISVLWMLHLYSMDVTSLFHGCYVSFPWMLHLCSMDVTSLFHGCYASVPWMLRLCSMDVTSLSHGCYISVPARSVPIDCQHSWIYIFVNIVAML